MIGRSVLVLLPVVPVVSAAMIACGSDPAPAVDAASTDPADGAPTGDAPPAGRDPATDGDDPVTSMTAAIPGAAAGRTLDATVFVPSSAGPHPLVIISPGFQMARTQYESYGHHLATWGFVAIVTDYAESGFFLDHQKLAQDVPAVIDWALAQSALAVDPARIATAGHSLGGKISVLAASLEPRIRAVVGWDPVDAANPSAVPEKIGGLAIPIAVVGETTNASGGGMPCAPAAENFAQFYAAAPGPALSITVAGADHMDWVDDPSCGFCGFCSPGSADAELARTASRRVDVAWLRRHLDGDTAMDRWLDMPPEQASGDLAIARK